MDSARVNFKAGDDQQPGDQSVRFRDDIGSNSGRVFDPQAALFSQQFVNSITVDLR